MRTENIRNGVREKRRERRRGGVHACVVIQWQVVSSELTYTEYKNTQPYTATFS